jgi:DNA-binding transcriptional LysR family regulator
MATSEPRFRHRPGRPEQQIEEIVTQGIPRDTPYPQDTDAVAATSTALNHIGGMAEIREIEALLALAEELHFGRAAARLRLTTSTVSQTIQVLERRVGAPLFERTSRRVRPTPLGEQLVADVKPAHELLRRAVVDARCSAAGRARELFVGFSRSLPPNMSDAICAGFTKSRPDIRIIPVDATQLDVLQYRERVGLGLDAVVGWLPSGIGDRPSTGTRAGPIIALAAPAVLVHPAHPFADQASIDVEQLGDLTFVEVTGMDTLTVAWVPCTTPAGRPIERRTRDLRYPEELFAMIARERGCLAHLTTREIASSWPDRGLAVVPVRRCRPFEVRAMWSEAAKNPEIAQFARIAASVGLEAGFLLAGPISWEPSSQLEQGDTSRVRSPVPA